MVPYGSIKENRRVLLIENTQTDRLLLRNWLTAERIEVYDAVDIITGLAACSRFQPNLILVQIRLPTWDGYEVIRRLKDDPRTLSIPVILLASCATTAEKAKGIDMGAVDFISKPFDPVELLARVHSSLRTKAYLDLLEQRAHIDGLTELSNRYALQDRLPQEWDTCLRRGNSLAIMIIDLDHFKRINDHYGHAAGDEVLRQMAGVLRSSFRETDFIARYGGEEFVVIAPDCDLAGAVAARRAAPRRRRRAPYRIPYLEHQGDDQHRHRPRPGPVAGQARRGARPGRPGSTGRREPAATRSGSGTRAARRRSRWKPGKPNPKPALEPPAATPRYFEP